MLLMDALIESAPLMRDLAQPLDPMLDICPDLAERLVGAPRFLLDAAAIRTILRYCSGLVQGALTGSGARPPGLVGSTSRAGRALERGYAR
jgi:hypothetical protein